VKLLRWLLTLSFRDSPDASGEPVTVPMNRDTLSSWALPEAGRYATR